MYIGEQLINPPADRLRLSAQLGVERVVIDDRGADLVKPGGVWDAEKLRGHRLWVESFGLKIDLFALDVGSSPNHGLNFCQVRWRRWRKSRTTM